MSDYRGLIKEMEENHKKIHERDLESGFHHSDSHERIVCFLYLIMRDELPTGAVCKHITDIAGQEFKFSNPHLEALARDYANRLREG
tara:strand:- start:657 stop:917 length:261 start_codon:yes stop_codon:yes gene_type:complete